jgi:hypothetical protein
MVIELAGKRSRLRKYEGVDLLVGRQEFDTRKEQEELLEDEMERCLVEVRLLRSQLV